jgi:carboxyl-terminal processing protease
MAGFGRFAKYGVLVVVFGLAAALTLKFSLGKGTSGVWNGLKPAEAAGPAASANGVKPPYDLTQLKVVNEVLKYTKKNYVDPKRVRAREMFLSALNYVQRDVAQIIVTHEEGSPIVKVRVDTQEREFKVDTVLGPWDVAARLRDVFAFVQEGLRGTEVDLREIEYAACNGMLHTLDPHSVLLSPEAYKDMNAQTSGQFGGLGIVISIRDDQLTVMNPMPGTPAQRADVKRLDRITKIDNESTLTMGLTEAVGHLRGAPASKVTIWIHRDGDGGWAGSKPFELTREVIKVKSVESQYLDGVGYIRLKQFQQQSSAEVTAALEGFRKRGDLRGVVLDLRGNPGGLLDQAARIVDTFVASGPIVATARAKAATRKLPMKRARSPIIPWRCWLAAPPRVRAKLSPAL